MARGAAEVSRRGNRHGRAKKGCAHAPPGFKSTFETASHIRLLTEGGLIAVLRTPGGSRAAHIVQLRPIGVEGGGEETPPEGLETGQAGLSGAAGGRGGQGG